MNDASAATYAARLIQRMDSQQCTIDQLAKACGCSTTHIKNARSGKLPMLGTEYHLRAAFFLRADPTWLAYGDALPINPDLEPMPLQMPRHEYDVMSEQEKDAFHLLLRRVVARFDGIRST